MQSVAGLAAESPVSKRNTSSSEGLRNAMSANSMFAEFSRDRAAVNIAGPSGAGKLTRSDSGLIAARLAAGSSGPSASAMA